MSDTQNQSIDETIRGQFESAWVDGHPVAIESLIPASSDPRYVGTLEELVHIELEFIWKQYRPTTETRTFDSHPTVDSTNRVENYLARFPALNKPDIVLRLIQQEFFVRSRHGDRPQANEYRHRFPEIVKSEEFLSDGSNEPQNAGQAVRDDTKAGDSLGRYLLVEEHGRGGFGCVWRADDPKLRRRIALKQLSRSVAFNDEQRKRFVNEARITARLEHPGIVPVYDLGELESDQPYYTMKLVGGQTFNAAIDRFHQDKPTLQSTELTVQRLRLLNAFLSVCRTMEYAHSHGVIHRDLKPQNIIVGEFGETIVLDWGLAKSLRSEEAAEAKDGRPVTEADIESTRAGTIQGTPAYMSPEQAAGRVDDVDGRSDIYALGTILYRILTGEFPFGTSDSRELLRRLQNETPNRPRVSAPDIPRSLEAICLKAMARKRDDRYANVKSLSQDLERHLADEPVSVYREGVAERLIRWARRYRAWAIAGVTTLIIAVAVSVTASVFINEERVAAREAEQNAITAKEGETAAKNLETDAKNKAIAAAKREQIARQEEERQRNSAEWRLVRSYQQNGRRHLNNADYLAALPWYVKALEVDAERPKEVDVHRRRIDTVLRRCPTLKHLHFLSNEPKSLRFSEDGKRLIVYGLRDASILDTTIGKPISHVEFEAGVMQAALSPDGTTIAASRVSTKGTEIKIFDLSTAKPRTTLPVFHKPTKSKFIAIGHLQFSRDGRYLSATCSTGYGKNQASFCRVWNLKTGQPLAHDFSHANRVTNSVFTPDGKRLATASWDKTAALWERSTGKQLKSWKHDVVLTRADISPAGDFLVTCSGHFAHVWKIPSGDKAFQASYPRGIGNSVMQTVFSSDGKYLATVNNAHDIRIWDMKSGGLVTQYSKHDGLIRDIKFAKHAPIVLSASSDGTARSWTAGRGDPVYPLFRHAGAVNGVAMSIDGKQLATIGADKTVRLWSFDPQGGPSSREWKMPPQFIKRVAFQPDGKKAVTVSQTGQSSVVRLWTVLSGKQQGDDRKYAGPITQVDFNATKNHLLITCTSKSTTAKLHFAEVRDEQGVIVGKLEHKKAINRAMLSEDGRILSTASDDKTAKIVDLTAKKRAIVLGHPGAVSGLHVSRDGRFVATACRDQHVRVWSVATGKLLYAPLKLPFPVTSVALNRTGRILVAVCTDHSKAKPNGQIFGWETATGKQLYGNIPHRGYLKPEFSPDGQTLFSCNTDKSVQLLRAKDGKAIGPPLTHQGAILTVRFSPDGNWVATGSVEGAVRVWSVASGLPIAPAISVGTAVAKVAFGPNSRFLLIRTVANSINVMDARTGERVAPAMNLSSFANDAVFSPDGKSILTAGRSARIWEFSPHRGSIAKLTALAELMSGHRIDQVESLVPLTPSQLQARWRAVMQPE